MRAMTHSRTFHSHSTVILRGFWVGFFFWGGGGLGGVQGARPVFAVSTVDWVESWNDSDDIFF